MSTTQREEKRRDIWIGAVLVVGGGGVETINTTAKRRRSLFNITPVITIVKLPYFVPHISFFLSLRTVFTSPAVVVDILFLFVYRYGYYDQEGKLQIVNYTADPVAGFHAEGEGVPKPQY